MSFFSSSNHTDRFSPADIQSNKTMAALSYLIILFFLPLLACPNSRFGRFHANQSLLILIVTVAGRVVFSIASLLFHFFLGPLIWILSNLFSLLMLALFVYGFINAVTGKAKEMPLIGQFRLIPE